jgi:hypothetical protein
LPKIVVGKLSSSDRTPVERTYAAEVREFPSTPGVLANLERPSAF